MKRAAFLIALAACGGEGKGGTPHAAVDPALDLAILLPGDMKRVEGGVVQVKREDEFADAAAWGAHLRAHNQSATVAEPTPDGDAWVTTLTPRSGEFPETRMWYRRLGDGLAITCFAMVAFRELTPDERDLARKVCAGTQRTQGGIYVPFQFSRTEKSTYLQVALLGEPLNWSVHLERVADSPDWRFSPEGVGGDHKAIDQGTLPGGRWFIAAGAMRSREGTHYDVVVRRTIGALELACHGDNYYDEAYTRRQLSLCLALEKP